MFRQFQLFQGFQASQGSFSSLTATFAQTGNPIACLSSSMPTTWVIDSGASDHMTGNAGILSTLQKSIFPPVRLADGSTSPVGGIGSAHLTPTISLHNVLYVPKFPYNLLSVSKITKDLNCSVTFYPDKCVFQDLETRTTIGVGREIQGLFQLDITSSPVAYLGVSSALELHCQLGHPSLKSLKQMRPELRHLSSLDCESCQYGKHHRVTYPSRINKRASRPFELVHSDVWGPCPVESNGGFKYFVSFIDDFSRVTWIYLIKTRSEIFRKFCVFFAEVKNQFQTCIKTLRSDNAREYFSSEFIDFMNNNGIIHESSCSYTPQQNGVAERKNRHLLEVARTLLFHRNVPKHFWGDAILTACYLINRMPSSILDGNIPFSILFPTVALFPLPPRIFGCTCFVHNHSPGHTKLDPRSIKCVFLGYSKFQKGYRCYSPHLRKSFTTADVTFFESQPYFPCVAPRTETISNEDDDYLVYWSVPSGSHLPSASTDPVQSPSESAQVHSDSTVTPADAVALLPSDPTPSVSSLQHPDTHAGESSSTLVPHSIPASDLDLPIALRKGTRSTAHPLYRSVSYARLSPTHSAFVSAVDLYPIPRSVTEALQHSGWRQAMLEEMDALEQNGTWDLVSLPSGKQPVGCKWVYAVKLNPDGSLARLKARLVAKGYSQTYGIDYEETFAPVAKMTSVRLLISLAATHHWPLHQLDVKNAFLNGVLAEEVYMEQPPGFVAQGESGKVCRLRRSLYGLKQSPRAWFGRFAEAVRGFGMKRCHNDHSVFYRSCGGRRILLVVYVDDIVITGDDMTGIRDLKAYIQKQFQTKDLGRLKYFLGIEIARSARGIFLSQRKYVLDMLSECGMLGCRPADSPMDQNSKLLPDQGELLDDPGRYRRLVGKLNYLTVTRPDIAFPVSVISQFMSQPRTGHWDAVIRILRYLKSAPGRGLLYRDGGHNRIAGFSDADWAGSPMDRRSTTGYCIFVGGNLVSWKSKKQSVVSRSSAESEYRSMANTTCEMVWIRRLLDELGFQQTSLMRLYCDNKAALHIASNPVFHERTKHIEIDCHVVREKSQGTETEPPVLETQYVSTGHQLADLLTKPLGKGRVQFICSKLGMIDIYAPA